MNVRVDRSLESSHFSAILLSSSDGWFSINFGDFSSGIVYGWMPNHPAEPSKQFSTDAAQISAVSPRVGVASFVNGCCDLKPAVEPVTARESEI
jgi:hypothetical protein